MKKWHYPFLAFLIIGTILILSKSRQTANPEYRTAQGLVFGTHYNTTYLYNDDLQPDIEHTLALVDSALSMFNPESTISQVNNSGGMQVEDQIFLKVFRRAMEISDWTDGAFDITVAPAVNAWGFGFKHAENIKQSTIDSLKEITGYKKIHEQDGLITKDDPRIMLDCSAIAKGFGSDMVADMFRSKGINDFMVEIGGEIVVSGHNPKGKLWNIGISKPVDDSLSVNNELQTVIPVTDIAMATSGNYRNFYMKDGRKYAHTIDPHTCMPVSHSLLSATVFAADCATADALATSMMVMGLDSARALCARHPEIQAYLIYQSADGTLGTSTNGDSPLLHM
ncbi:MAG: FAD:protein FMN transferase [Bacteroidaceae bacterium]|nr:FAD:protein FMN transferase [Bacteroidaceae bacterium]